MVIPYIISISNTNKVISTTFKHLDLENSIKEKQANEKIHFEQGQESIHLQQVPDLSLVLFNWKPLFTWVIISFFCFLPFLTPKDWVNQFILSRHLYLAICSVFSVRLLRTCAERPQLLSLLWGQTPHGSWSCCFLQNFRLIRKTLIF